MAHRPDLFRNLKYPHAGIYFFLFPNRKAVGIDPCPVGSSHRDSQARQIVRGTYGSISKRNEHCG